MWSPSGDLDPKPADYRSAALPLSYSGEGARPKSIVRHGRLVVNADKTVTSDHITVL